MKHLLTLFLTALGLSLSFSSALAVEFFPRSTDTAILQQDAFQIYPPNQPGNGLYFEEQWLASDPRRIILSAQLIYGLEGKFVYLYRENSGALRLDVAEAENANTLRLQPIDDRYYEVLETDSRTLKLFRLFRGEIQPLLGRSRTATGLVASDTHAVFYNIIKSEMVEPSDGTDPYRTYTFRLHVVRHDTEGYRSIRDLEITDVLARLDLSWADEKTVRYTLRQGGEQSVDLSRYLPNLF